MEPRKGINGKKTLIVISISAIVISAAMILWFYKTNNERPVPLPRTAEAEIKAATEDTGIVGQENPNNVSAPVEISKAKKIQRVVKTEEAQASKHEILDAKPEKVIDTLTLVQIRRIQEKAREARPDIGSGTGTSGGPQRSGVGHTFRGRAFKTDNTVTDCQEAGKVILEVQLLPSGKIIFEDVNPATTGSDCLVKAAKEILKKSSFNESTEPASYGTITFIFKLN